MARVQPRDVTREAARTSSRPDRAPLLGPAAFDQCRRSISGRHVVESSSQSPRSNASNARRTISTFSCDIAYSRSPAASRASAQCRVIRRAGSPCRRQTRITTPAMLDSTRRCRARAAHQLSHGDPLVTMARGSISLDSHAREDVAQLGQPLAEAPRPRWDAGPRHARESPSTRDQGRRAALACRSPPRLRRASQPAHDLHVLLRHRPRSISLRGEADCGRWAVPGSNQRPPACKAGALPTELTARRRLIMPL